MFSLSEYEKMDNNVVVERLLVMVHQAITENFPDADSPSQQFKKTVFSAESTALNNINELRRSNSDRDYSDEFSSEFNSESDISNDFDGSEFPSQISQATNESISNSFEQGVDTVTNSRLDHLSLIQKKSIKEKLPGSGVVLLGLFVLLVIAGLFMLLF